MILYIGRFPSEEFSVSDLYEDIEHVDCEIELTVGEYADLKAVNEDFYSWQARLGELYEKSPRKDKR